MNNPIPWDSLPVSSEFPKAGDELLMKVDGETQRVDWSTISPWLGKLVSVPASPTSTGNPGEFAVDTTYLYVYNGSGWSRFTKAAWV